MPIQVSGVFVHGIAAYLLHPFLVRMFRDPGNVHASAFQMEEEQHIVGYKPSPAEHLNREEIAPCQHVQMSREELYRT